jgi:hypothetical protein
MAELGNISTAVWEGGLLTVGGTGVKEEFGSLSRAECEGKSGKMARVGGRIILSTITKYHLFGVFGTVRRTRAKEEIGTISRAGREGGSGIWPGWLGGQE